MQKQCNKFLTAQIFFFTLNHLKKKVKQCQIFKTYRFLKNVYAIPQIKLSSID